MSKTILIVEDAAIISQPIEAALRREGFSTVRAENGLEALARLSAHPVDLILLDIAMPVMDGLTFLEQIRKDPAYQNLPVIVLTALADKSKVVQAAKLRIISYLLKSNFSLSELLGKVRQAFAAAANASAASSAASPSPTPSAPTPNVPEATVAGTRGQKVSDDSPLPGTSSSGAVVVKGGAALVTAAASPNSANMKPLTRAMLQGAKLNYTSQIEAVKSLKPIMTRADVIQILQECDELRAFSPTVTQVLKLTSNPYCSIDRVVRAISQDHAIALKILKMANSVVYSRGEPVDSIHAAVTRIGLDRIRQAVLNIGVIEHFANSISVCHISFAQFWEHAIACGLIASELANALEMGKIAERAFTMGLLHDVGRIVCIEQLKERYAQVVHTAHEMELPMEQVEARMLMLNHADVMEHVLKAWQFSEHLINPIVHHHLSADTIRQLLPKEVTETTILGLANRLAHAYLLGTSGNHVIYPIEDLMRTLNVPPTILDQLQRTVEEQTVQMKMSMLSRSNQDNWAPIKEEYRAHLPKPFRPLYLCPDRTMDSFGIFLDTLGQTGELEHPNLAVVHLPNMRYRATLSTMLKEYEAHLQLEKLPTIVLSPTGQLTLEDSMLVKRNVQLVTTPMVVSRFLRSVNQVLGVMLPTSPASAA